jgi:hypothetical protein
MLLVQILTNEKLYEVETPSVAQYSHKIFPIWSGASNPFRGQTHPLASKAHVSIDN